MQTYTFDCADGTSRKCHGTVEQELEIPDLTEEQLEEIAESGSTEVTAEQVGLADPAYVDLEDEEWEALEERGEVKYHFKNLELVCAQCGRDQD